MESHGHPTSGMIESKAKKSQAHVPSTSFPDNRKKKVGHEIVCFGRFQFPRYRR
jgi:hypothetical protein